MPINTADYVYRFDLPSFDTYSLGTSTDDSQTLIKDIAVSESSQTFYTLLNVEDGNVEVGGNLTSKSLTTGNLLIEGGVDIDTGEYFDTLVLRRPTGNTGVTDDYFIIGREIQLWVNGSNVLTCSGVNAYYADWSVDKNTPKNFNLDPSGSINNVIESDLGFVSSSDDSDNSNIALIIKDIPLTIINDIQAIVYYNRNSSVNADRVIGIGVELYNKTNDPDLIKVLANTNEIMTYEPVYRFNFPSISTYSSDDFVNEDSVDFITNNATTENASYELNTFEVKGNASIKGDLVVGDVNIITELVTKQPTIDTNTDLSSKTLTTTGNIISPSFRVVKLVDNVNDIFPSTSSSLSVDLLTFNVFGGTLKFDFDCNAVSLNQSGTTHGIKFSLLNANSTIVEITNIQFYFFTKDFHFHFGSTDVYTSVPAGTYTLRVVRSSTDILHTADDSFNVTMTEFPF